MNKKIVLICIIVLFLVFISAVAFYHSGYRYDKLVVNEDTWNKIISEREMSDTNLITSIKFNEYDLLYDNVNCTYYYSLVENDNNKYNPIVKYKTNKNDLQIVIDKKITDELIESNGCINVMLYNDTEFSIYGLRCSTLPLLNISSPDMSEVSKQRDVDINLSLFDNRKDSVKRLTVSEGKMHVRGAITSVFAKKGFKISLDTRTVGNSKRQNYISMLGMRQDDDWILYAAYNDQEKIRNVFASNLWYESCSKNNNFGINNGSQYEYVELFLNNEYWGLYALGHRIDRKQLNLDDDEFTFKKTQYDEAEINLLTNKKLDITNYKLVYNSGDEKEDWKALTDYYNTLLTSQNIEELYNISDINNLIDYYLFQEVIQANDNAREMYLKNIFITMKNYKGRKVVLYTPWDYDQCMGNIYGVDGKNFTLPYYVEVDEKIDFKLNAIGALQKLGDTKINELIKNRYNDLRKTYWSEKHLEEVIDEYSKEIYDSGAFNRDKNRWHDGSFNEETEKLTKFKEYVLERLKCTDEFINSI